jgi:hypothetical protein
MLSTAGAVLAVGSVVLAVASTRVSDGLTHQRERTCDGLLPMPTSAYLLGWLGVGVAALAVVLSVLRVLRSRGDSGWRMTLLVFSVLCLLSAGFVIYTVYGDAPIHRFLCSG